MQYSEIETRVGVSDSIEVFLKEKIMKIGLYRRTKAALILAFLLFITPAILKGVSKEDRHLILTYGLEGSGCRREILVSWWEPGKDYIDLGPYCYLTGLAFYLWLGEDSINFVGNDVFFLVNDRLIGLNLVAPDSETIQWRRRFDQDWRPLQLKDIQDPSAIQMAVVGEKNLIDLDEFPNLKAIKSYSVGDHDLASLIRIKNLEVLDLSVFPHLTDTALLYIGKMKNLKVLRLGGSLDKQRFTSAGFKHLSNLTSLRSLSLSFCGVTDSDLIYLKGLTELRELNLSRNSGISSKGLEHLAGLTNLQALSLASTSAASGLRYLSGLKHLQVLNLGSAAWDGTMVYLEQFPELRVLGLSGCFITDQGLAMLPPLPHLEELSFSDTEITDQGLKYLYKFKNLRKLVLIRTMATYEGGVKPLMETLPGCAVQTAP